MKTGLKQELIRYISFSCFFCIVLISYGQELLPTPSSVIYEEIKQLNTLGRVLYIAAHPDDENTRFISWCTKAKGLETAYLSLTRGDGGQNLIGSELRESLGIVRTQELLEARRIDGAKQFFTRANDFGYSKNPNETFSKWDKTHILSDVVWVIRKFKPDIIITRFNPEPGTTHGHHTASCLLALEAIDAAADPTRFPEQLTEVKTWKSKRVLWNASKFFFTEAKPFDAKLFLSQETGNFLPEYGETVQEIAARSRTQHKSQGFGTAGIRGSYIEYFKFLKGDSVTNGDVFQGLDFTWERITGAGRLQAEVIKIVKDFKPDDPSASIKPLISLYTDVSSFPESYWRNAQLLRIKNLIVKCSGLFADVSTSKAFFTQKDSIPLKFEISHPNSIKIEIKKIELFKDKIVFKIDSVIPANTPWIFSHSIVFPENSPISVPYWMNGSYSEAEYVQPELNMTGLPENHPLIIAKMNFVIEGLSILLEIPIKMKDVDPVKGEVKEPIYLIPEITAIPFSKSEVIQKGKEIEYVIQIESNSEMPGFEIIPSVGKEWVISPQKFTIPPLKSKDKFTLKYKVKAPKNSDNSKLYFNYALENKLHPLLMKSVITYDHIKPQVMLNPAEVTLVSTELNAPELKIGYINGAGDALFQILGKYFKDISLISSSEIKKDVLKEYKVIILGIRAFNTLPELSVCNTVLFDFVFNGGTLIVQYNTLQELVTDSIAPVKLKLSRNRITNENSPVEFLNKTHQILNFPNLISEKDFDGWVQERGLYFPGEWDTTIFKSVISMNDPRENSQSSGILIGDYGKGKYVYTSLSWFRQLPVGVPGAFKLFFNLISAGIPKEDYERR